MPSLGIAGRSYLALVLASSFLGAARADDWPQWLGPQRDGVWRETSILDHFPKDGPKLRWRTPVGQGYAGPAVADGKVFVTDRVLPEGVKNPANPFARGSVPGKERVLCLNDADGKILWQDAYDCDYKVAYPAGPRTTPLVQGKKVYTLGAMGDLRCLDIDSGNLLWSKNFPKDFQADIPVWGWASSPLLDGDRLICLVGGPDSVVVAFHKDTGKELWRALSAPEPGYAPPMIYEFGGKRQLIIWHPQAINGLDPETGKVYWAQPFAVKAGLSIPTPRQSGNELFITSFYNGSILLRFEADADKPVVVWKSKSKGEMPNQTRDLSSIMPTPYIKDGYLYGMCSYGEMRCLKLDSGERVWESLQATGSHKKNDDRWKNAFLVPHGENVFLFTEAGDLIIAKLTPTGYAETSRAHLLDPTNPMAGRSRLVVWSHPAFANKSIYARNDKEVVCYSLAADASKPMDK
jgi:outer membrane protein assembly factor BamB